jgi:hypothetical protein
MPCTFLPNGEEKYMADMDSTTAHSTSMIAHALESAFAVLVALPTILIAGIVGLTLARRLGVIFRH